MRNLSKSLSVCLFVLLCFLLHQKQSHASDPAASLPILEAQSGDILNVPLQVENLQNLEGLDIKISFNPDLISMDAATFDGGVLEFQNYSLQFNNNNPGQVTITVYATGNLFSGSGDVLFLTVSCLSAGFTDLIFEKFDVNETCYLSNVTIGSITIVSGQSQTITLLEGWNSLSSNLIPENSDITTIMNGIEQELIIIQNYNGFYWPVGGVNSLLNWEFQSGYLIKVSGDIALNITGSIPEDKYITLGIGWNLIPVLSEANVSIVDLFAGNLSNLVILKEAIGTKLYWPQKNISSIQMLEPGKAYFVKMNTETTITF